MLTAAEFGTGEILWSIFWFSIFALWILLAFTVFADLIASDELSGMMKAGWTAAIVLVPYLGILAYLVAHGDEMSWRILDRAQAGHRSSGSQITAIHGSSSLAGRAASLAKLHDEGALSDDEFEEAKQQLLNG